MSVAVSKNLMAEMKLLGMLGTFDQVVAEELDLATVQLSPIVASKRNWRFLEVASWIYFYSSPILVRIRLLAVRVVWTVVRMFLPPAWRDRIKQWSRRRWSPRGR